jgi:hypothetical protein
MTSTFYTIFHKPTGCNVRLTHEVTEQEWQAAMDWMVGQAKPVLSGSEYSPLVFEK